jgi:hypothetical protein
MDGDADAYFALLSSMTPDQVLPCLREDLVSPDEDRRRTAVAYVSRSAFLLECFDFAGHLAKILKGPRTEAHQPAAASLVALGWRAALALKQALCQRSDEGSQVRLVETLSRVCRTLDSSTCRAIVDAFLFREMVLGVDRPAAVRAAGWKAWQALNGVNANGNVSLPAPVVG